MPYQKSACSRIVSTFSGKTSENSDSAEAPPGHPPQRFGQSSWSRVPEPNGIRSLPFLLSNCLSVNWKCRWTTSQTCHKPDLLWLKVFSHYSTRFWNVISVSVTQPKRKYSTRSLSKRCPNKKRTKKSNQKSKRLKQPASGSTLAGSRSKGLRAAPQNKSSWDAKTSWTFFSQNLQVGHTLSFWYLSSLSVLRFQNPPKMVESSSVDLNLVEFLFWKIH